MFGLEKDNKSVKKFDFDLEKELKQDPGRAKALIENCQTRINQIKKSLREGEKEEAFDHFGLLLHGYDALSRVLKKVIRK